MSSSRGAPWAAKRWNSGSSAREQLLVGEQVLAVDVVLASTPSRVSSTAVAQPVRSLPVVQW